MGSQTFEDLDSLRAAIREKEVAFYGSCPAKLSSVRAALRLERHGNITLCWVDSQPGVNPGLLRPTFDVFRWDNIKYERIDIHVATLARGVSAPRIGSVIPLTPQAIRKVGHRYQQGGLERALYEKERPGAAEVLDDGQKQRIIAMVCSDPPEGRARWTVRLVVEEAVKRRLVPRVGDLRPPEAARSLISELERYSPGKH